MVCLTGEGMPPPRPPQPWQASPPHMWHGDMKVLDSMSLWRQKAIREIIAGCQTKVLEKRLRKESEKFCQNIDELGWVKGLHF